MPSPSDLATNLGQYHIVSLDTSDGDVLCDFENPFGSFGAEDSTTVTAWGISRRAGLPCVVILQLNVNQHYIIPYATMQYPGMLMEGYGPRPSYQVMQAVAYDMDRAYDWMLRQGSLGSIVYRDDSGLVFDNTGRWVWMGSDTLIGFNGTGVPSPDGPAKIATKPVP